VDESGNPLAPTYPKRARGLVKAGRARYAPGDENTIILSAPRRTGPPVTDYNNLPEDNKVDTAFTYKADAQNIEAAGTAEIQQYTADRQYKEKMLAYIMNKIDELARYPEYIDNAVAKLGTMQVNECPNGGTGDAARANAIGNSIAAREETNRALIEFLKQIYNDVKPVNEQVFISTPQESARLMVYQMLCDLLLKTDKSDAEYELMSRALDSLDNWKRK
jgi:hypothetical protein